MFRYRGPKRGSWDTKTYRDYEARDRNHKASSAVLAILFTFVLAVGVFSMAKVLGMF